MKQLSIVLILCFFTVGNAQEKPVKNDSITLTQAFVNLTLTKEFFKELPRERTERILPFVYEELEGITSEEFRGQNKGLLDFTYGLYHLNDALFRYTYRDSIQRTLLVQLFQTLDKAIKFQNSAVEKDYYYMQITDKNPYHEMMNYGMQSFYDQWAAISDLKATFTRLFNQDVYAEFKKIFYNAKAFGTYRFDDMAYFAGLYNFNFELHVLHLGDAGYVDWRDSSFIHVNSQYDMEEKLHALAQYLQLYYFVFEEEVSLPEWYPVDSLHYYYHTFKGLISRWNYFEGDPFFQRELNEEIVEALYKKLQERYPSDYLHTEQRLDNSLSYAPEQPVKYFFPNPAPLPSARLFIPNYQEELSTLETVAAHLEGYLQKGGYKNKLRYYYSIDGFAVLTKLERFNKDGSRVNSDRRWVDVFGDGKFSYYQIFKSLFFEVSTQFRMFAFVIASKIVKVSSQPMTAQEAQELLMHGYDTLPEELREVVLNPKNLSVLVYHFHQNVSYLF